MAKVQAFVTDFLAFGTKQVLCCVFPAYIFGMLAISQFLPPGWMPRYDFLLLACLLMQALMVGFRLETRDELLVICLFHLLGLAMEVFKVKMGSWSYPEFAWTKFAGVPLYSGFMYASVASYMCQAWRRFSLQIVASPDQRVAVFLGAAIYLNFFTHHFSVDIRYGLAVFVLLAYRRSWVFFTPFRTPYQMPVWLSFLLIGFFIWVAENIATFLGAWKYAHQHVGWKMVHFQKAGSWTLMCIVSYIVVSELKFRKERATPKTLS